jgi:hypothetical protein
MMNKFALGINSILIAIATAIIGTILHELAHYVVARYFDLAPVLHHNFVKSTIQGTDWQRAVVAGAGPLFSLIFGAVVLRIAHLWVKPSLLKLFLTWLGMGSVLCMFGYLLIAPLAAEGDTGRVFAYLKLPKYLTIGIALLSFMLINNLFGRWSSYFVYYKHDAVFDRQQTRLQLFTYPIYASILIMTCLSLPVHTWVSLLPTLCMPMTYFSTSGNYNRLDTLAPSLEISKVSPVLVTVTLVVIILFRYLV